MTFHGSCFGCLSLKYDYDGSRCLGCCYYECDWSLSDLSVSEEQYKEVMEEKARCRILSKELDPEKYLHEIKNTKPRKKMWEE
jgi:hypothetical protein